MRCLATSFGDSRKSEARCVESLMGDSFAGR